MCSSVHRGTHRARFSPTTVLMSALFCWGGGFRLWGAARLHETIAHGGREPAQP